MRSHENTQNQNQNLIKTNTIDTKTISKPIPRLPKLYQNQYQNHQNHTKTNTSKPKLYQSQYLKTKSFGFGACLLPSVMEFKEFKENDGIQEIKENEGKCRKIQENQGIQEIKLFKISTPFKCHGIQGIQGK